jgi:hypothetical protein
MLARIFQLQQKGFSLFNDKKGGEIFNREQVPTVKYKKMFTLILGYCMCGFFSYCKREIVPKVQHFPISSYLF